MSSLFHFLTDMAVDPKKQIMFEEDPQAMIAAAGLSDQIGSDSGDRVQWTEVFVDELETHELVAVIGNCAASDPGPDPTPDPDPFPGNDDGVP